MGQELSDRNFLFSILSKLRPVFADTLIVIQPAARVGNSERHRRHALGSRIDQSLRVFLPRLTSRFIPNTAPKVNDLFTSVIHTTGRANLAPLREILGKRFAYCFVSGICKPVN